MTYPKLESMADSYAYEHQYWNTRLHYKQGLEDMHYRILAMIEQSLEKNYDLHLFQNLVKQLKND